jgi:hypothetical protein
LFLFDEDESGFKLAGDLLTDDQTAHGGRNNIGNIERNQLFDESGGELFDMRHELQSEGALKELPAMKTGSEHEVAIQQGSRLFKYFQGFGFIHDAI